MAFRDRVRVQCSQMVKKKERSRIGRMHQVDDMSETRCTFFVAAICFYLRRVGNCVSDDALRNGTTFLVHLSTSHLALRKIYRTQCGHRVHLLWKSQNGADAFETFDSYKNC